MTETRINPNDGLLDVFHPDTSAWARAVAPLQIAGGTDVRLVSNQGQFLADIASDIQTLDALLTALQGISSSTGALLQKSTQMALSLDATTNSTLGAIAQTVGLLNIKNIELTNYAQNIANLLDGGYNYNARFDDLEALLTQTNQALAEVEAATALAGTKVDATTAAVAGQNLTACVIKTATFAVANTEYPVVLTNGAKTVRLRSRKVSGTAYDLRYSFEQGQVAGGGTRFAIMNSDSEYVQNGLNLTGAQLYLACANTAAIAEVEIWT